MSRWTGPYDNESGVRARVEAGRHREIIGGLWDEMGALQLDFLISRGLQPEHSLLDLGCGAGRLAVRAVPYLARDRYYGLDLSASLLQAARHEIDAAGFGERLNERTFHATSDFRPHAEMPRFDYVIAQSLFTHLPLERFGAALDALRGHVKPGTRFYATFFTAPAGTPKLHHVRGGVTTHVDRDPIHFAVEEVAGMARQKGWMANWIGEWNHPRDQQMAEFLI
jgi:SAM-dependent methyltransferase